MLHDVTTLTVDVLMT